MRRRLLSGAIQFPAPVPYAYIGSRRDWRRYRAYELKSAIRNRSGILRLRPLPPPAEVPRRPRRLRRPRAQTVVLPPMADPGPNTRRLHDAIEQYARANPSNWNALDALCGHCSELAPVGDDPRIWRAMVMRTLNIGRTSTKIMRSLYTCGDTVEYTTRAYNRLVNTIIARSADQGLRRAEYEALCDGYDREPNWGNYVFSADSTRRRWPTALIDLGLRLFAQYRV